MSVSHAPRHSRGAVSRLTAALLCVLLLLTSLSFLGGADVFASGTRTFRCVKQDAGGNRYQVQVRCGDDAGIPSDAVLQVEELTEASADYDAYLARTEAALSCESGTVGFVRFFDISLVSPDSTVRYQPAGGSAVEVFVRLEEEPQNDLSVVHFAEDEPPEVLECTTDGDTVSFETTGFSVYALVDAPAPYSGEITTAQTLSEVQAEPDAGYFFSVYRNSRMYYFTSESNSSNAFVVQTSINLAETWYFEPAGNGQNQFYIYTLENGVRRYIHNQSGNLAELSAQGSVFELTEAPGGTFYLKLAGENKWLQYSNSGTGIRFWTDNNNATNARITLTYASSLEPPDDPYGLSGKSFGIVRYAGASAISAYELTAEPNPADGSYLAANTVQLQMNPLDYESNLLVADGDLTMWTFHSIGGSAYHITTQVNGATKYLRIEGTSVQLVDTPDAYCAITATPGTGTRAGMYQFSSPGGKLEYASKKINRTDYNVFDGASSNTNNSWLKLAVPSDLTTEDLVSYSAEKVSIAYNAQDVQNGDQIVIYTRIWNDTAKEYEFYVVNHNGRLVRAYDEGDTVRWEGSAINTMLWDFTEYFYAGTTTPNYYYELQNVYSGKYLAPQIQDGQIVSDSTIGLTLNGRRWNDYYSNIMAWDDPHYDYAAYATDGTERIIPVPMAQGMDFYFAKMEPAHVELTTADTVDNNDFGISLRMIKFPADQTYGRTATNGGRNRMQTDVIGAGTDYVSNDMLKFPTLGLVTTDLGENGYPTATLTGTSLEALFGDATDANHLFLQHVYDESGYFQYDCTQTFATLGDDGDFTVYNQLGTINISANSQGHGQFMPYNDLDPDNVSDYVYRTDVHNNPISLDNPRYGEELLSIPLSEAQYHFGMEMEASFIQSPGGLDAWGHDIVFEFAGDDDMWLYVDGELVLDLGGIHSALVGKINFSTGIVTVPIKLPEGTPSNQVSNYTEGNSAKLVTRTLREIFEENYRGRHPEATDDDVEAYLNGIFDENSPGRTVFKDFTAHTMKMLYMERGASMSNLHMRFNLTTATNGQLLLKKTVSGTDKQDYSSAHFGYQVWYYDTEYSEWRTVSRTEVPGEGGEVSYQYTGVSSVTYEGTSTPVEYQSSWQGYDNVFFLTPGQVADIRFPDDTTEYFVRECYLDTSIYDAVTINNVPAAGTPVGTDLADFSSAPEVIGQRKVVNFDNHVDEDALRNLLITKRLFDAYGNPLHYEDDPTGFRFRLYMGGAEPLDYYRLDKYHVKDPQGCYCYYDADTAAFASTGVSDLSLLSEEMQQRTTFTTSPSGSIDKIPADYTVEIRNLLVDTKFRVEERFSDIPKGYNLISYERLDGSYIILEGDTENSGTIRDNASPHIIVNNQRGWGLTVVKNWSDRDFMQSHDDIFIAVYNSHDYPVIDSTAVPLAGTVRVYTASTSSLYYYFENLGEGTQFSDYVVREVVLIDPVVDENGYVTSYTGITPVDPGGTLHAGGIPNDSSAYEEHDYLASYAAGIPTGISQNVRTDTVTNARMEGIRIVKTDWLGTPLPDAVFKLEDENGDPVGQPRFTSGADGLVTTAYLEEDAPYTLTELCPPYQYTALMDAVTMTLSDGTLTLAGAPQDAVRVEPDDPSGMLTVYVRNRPASLQIRKVDAADPTAGLAGVHFALYRQVMGVSGPRKDYFPIEGMEDLVTDQSGNLTAFPDWLPAGSYYLTETATLPGYTPLAEDIILTVEESGAVTVQNTFMQSWLTSDDDPVTGERTYVLTVENSGTKSITLVKTDMEGTLYLSGAQFILYRKRDFDDSTSAPLPNAQVLVSGETDENGVLQLGNLPIGEYRLVETVAPFTYIRLTEPVRLFVYQASVEILQSSAYTSAVVQQDGTYLITVRNRQGCEIPSVGGIGTLWHYLGGMIVLTGTLALAASGRRRRRKRQL